MHPQLTIGMPLFNDAKYVQETIKSLLSQSFKSFQLIIVDDCSTDNSVSVVKQLASADSRIILYQNNSNIGNLRNFLRLIELCDTEYFCWIGSHDLVESSYYEILISELNNNKYVDYAYGRCVFIDEFGIECSKSPDLNFNEGRFASDPIHNFFMSIGRARTYEIHFYGVYRSEMLNGFGARQKKAYVGWDHVVSSLAFYYGAIYNHKAELKPRVFSNRTSTTYSRLIGNGSRRMKLRPTIISLVKSYILEYWNLPESVTKKILYFPALITSLRDGYEIRFLRNFYWQGVSLIKFLFSFLKV